MKMKRMILVFILAFLTGCSNQYEVKDNKEDAAEQIQLSNSEAELNVFQTIVYEDGSQEKAKGFESIVLLTDALKDSEGNFLWDDGNNFTLKLITTSGEIEIMPLEYFQFASFDINSYLKLNENTFCILMKITSGAKCEIREYTFEENEKRFEGKIIYEAVNINNIRKSESIGEKTDDAEIKIGVIKNFRTSTASSIRVQCNMILSIFAV